MLPLGGPAAWQQDADEGERRTIALAASPLPTAQHTNKMLEIPNGHHRK